MTDTQKKRLVAAAVKAAGSAYCPYSGFRVGAAILDANNVIHSGCNVENASFGLTICAERAAAAAAVAAGAVRFKALAVAAGRGSAAYPCGACRQVLAEFCGPDTPVYLAAVDRPDTVETATIGELLPHSFGLRRRQRGGPKNR